jgi:hypothetical protein
VRSRSSFQFMESLDLQFSTHIGTMNRSAIAVASIFSSVHGKGESEG